MFVWKTKRSSEALEGLSAFADVAEVVANRRAIGLFPPPQTRVGNELNHNERSGFHQLVISLAAKQADCCIRVVNAKKKSRTAILVFKGRILGCVYGRKGMTEQLFGQSAHANALADIAMETSSLDAYMLPPELVLAAASLFHGQVLSQAAELTIEQNYELVCQHLLQSNLPGCMVIHNREKAPVSMIYICSGKIVGVYSCKDGWAESDYEAGLRSLSATPDARLISSRLPSAEEADIAELTFSLTGLLDIDRQKSDSEQ